MCCRFCMEKQLPKRKKSLKDIMETMLHHMAWFTELTVLVQTQQIQSTLNV